MYLLSLFLSLSCRVEDFFDKEKLVAGNFREEQAESLAYRIDHDTTRISKNLNRLITDGGFHTIFFSQIYCKKENGRIPNLGKLFLNPLLKLPNNAVVASENDEWAKHNAMLGGGSCKVFPAWVELDHGSQAAAFDIFGPRCQMSIRDILKVQGIGKAFDNLVAHLFARLAQCILSNPLLRGNSTAMCAIFSVLFPNICKWLCTQKGKSTLPGTTLKDASASAR